LSKVFEEATLTVRFIDAHAECDCSHYDLAITVLPQLLNTLSVCVGQPGVEMSGIEMLRSQPHGHLLSFIASNAIDDPCLVRMLLCDELDNAGFHISLLGYDLVAQIGAIKRL
jgi:hypothetical protein